MGNGIIYVVSDISVRGLHRVTTYLKVISSGGGDWAGNRTMSFWIARRRVIGSPPALWITDWKRGTRWLASVFTPSIEGSISCNRTDAKCAGHTGEGGKLTGYYTH